MYTSVVEQDWRAPSFGPPKEFRVTLRSAQQLAQVARNPSVLGLSQRTQLPLCNDETKRAFTNNPSALRRGRGRGLCHPLRRRPDAPADRGEGLKPPVGVQWEISGGLVGS